MLVLIGGVIAPPASAQWKQWGGPNQDFVANSKGLASAWSEGGPRKLWSRELGEGYSAVLADEGKLYTMYRGDDKEVVICMDAATGKTIWEYKYESAPHEGHVKEFGSGPRSTPLISGDRLYTIGVAGKMHCLNKSDGKVHWSKELWNDMKGSFLNHGYASSPIGYKDTVIVLVGGEDQSIVAFNKTSGDIAWKNQSFGNSYSTPKIIKVDGEDQLVTFLATEIVGVDPNNGDLKWKYGQTNEWKQNICMPVWAPGNMLVFSSPDAGARGLKLTRHGDKTDIEEVWSTRKIQFYHVTAVGIGDYVYGSTGMGQGPAFMAAIDARTGKVAWRERGFAKATCVLADGKLVILDEDGQLALATATPEGLTVHAKAPVLEKVAWTVPTIVDHTLFVRDKKTIMALDLG